jgi:hypothetical protein
VRFDSVTVVREFKVDEVRAVLSFSICIGYHQ